MTQNPETRKVIDRLEIVKAYLSTGMAPTLFVELFNAGDTYGKLREETGPVDAEDLDWWATICMGVLDSEEVTLEMQFKAASVQIEEQNKTIDQLRKEILGMEEARYRGVVMERAHKAEIASLQKKIERNSYYTDSLHRHIDMLEEKCAYLQAEQRETLKEQREHLQSLAAQLSTNGGALCKSQKN